MLRPGIRHPRLGTFSIQERFGGQLEGFKSRVLFLPGPCPGYHRSPGVVSAPYAATTLGACTLSAPFLSRPAVLCSHSQNGSTEHSMREKASHICTSGTAIAAWMSRRNPSPPKLCVPGKCLFENLPSLLHLSRTPGAKMNRPPRSFFSDTLFLQGFFRPPGSFSRPFSFFRPCKRVCLSKGIRCRGVYLSLVLFCHAV